MIKEIAFTAYPVTDMARARAFYEGVLGLTVETNHGDKWVEYGLNGMHVRHPKLYGRNAERQPRAGGVRGG